MFGAGAPRNLIRGMPPREYRRMQAYYRYISGWKPPTEEASVTVEKTGDEIEKDAVIVE